MIVVCVAVLTEHRGTVPMSCLSATLLGQWQQRKATMIEIAVPMFGILSAMLCLVSQRGRIV